MAGEAAASPERTRLAGSTAAPRPPVATNDRPAALRPEFVERVALVEGLAAISRSALVLMVAPAGYGKTTLLAQWERRDPRPFEWIEDAMGPASPAEWRSRLLELSPGGDEPVIVVVDDAHLARPLALATIIEVILNHCPAGSLAALAARTELDLPVGRLRGHRTLFELRTRDLAMTRDEATALLELAGFGLDDEVAFSVLERAGGWPAVLYLAGMSRSACAGTPTEVGTVGDRDDLVAGYVRDEVLSQLSPQLVAFARRAAVLDELNGPLCAAVTEEEDAALSLERLAQRSGLLEPLPGPERRFRWSPLFRATLVAHLRVVEPRLEPVLRERASAWWFEQREIERAIDYACSAQDPDRAGELLEEHLVVALTHGRTELIERWLAALGPRHVADHPQLSLCAAHLALATGDSEGAQRSALTAAGIVRRSHECAPSGVLAARLALIDAALGHCGPAAMCRQAASSHDAEPADSLWRPMCLWLMGTAEHLAGERAAAAERLDLAADLGAAAVPTTTALALSQRALIAIEEQAWDLAADVTDRTASLIADCGLARLALMALPLGVTAAVRAHHGRIDEAKHELRTSIDLLAGADGFPAWYAAETRLVLAHASLWLADVVGARTLLAQASRLARRARGAVVLEPWFDDAWSYLDTLAEASLSGPSTLTIAELKILRFLPTHRSLREIATQLGVSTNTVKTQAHAVYRKLGASSRSEAVALAQAAGLLGQ